MLTSNSESHSSAAIPEIGLRSFRDAQLRLPLSDRTRSFSLFLNDLKARGEHSYFRLVSSPAGREVTVLDAETGAPTQLLMFASNNYLGLANHPYVRQKVKETIGTYGVGVGGPPLLNGYTKKMNELEERLAHFKHQEDALIFSTGFAANLGLMAAVTGPDDAIVFDALSHASLLDGLKLSDALHEKVAHNDVAALEKALSQHAASAAQLFVAVEGVYSMDGDLAPLDRIVPLCKKYKALCLLDDAHGTGVLGSDGSGTAAHFGLEGEIDVSMGTFSKAFAVTGGFIAASREVVQYLRYFARSYMFSAALPPMNLAAVLAGIEVIEREPERRLRLLEQAEYAREKLGGFEFYARPQAAIIALKAPQWLDIRRANRALYQRGIFLNAIEYPAVAHHVQRFRISLMADHTRSDIDRLVSAIEDVWDDPSCRLEDRR